MATEGIVYKSTITCPNCGHQSDITLDDDSCVHFYKCEKCGNIMKPKKGECCVSCSYGSVKCPTMQKVMLEVSGDYTC